MNDMMPIMLLAIGILLSIVVILRRAKRKNKQSSPSVHADDYTKVPQLLTPTELAFYQVLTDALPTEYTCMTQVALNRLIKVQKPRFGAAWRDPRWNRIAQKSIDFVVVRRSDLRVMVLIELDDASHQKAQRQQRDTFLDTVCANINLPIIHIPVQSHYQRHELQMRLLGYLTAK
jgi:hypothetical protein